MDDYIGRLMVVDEEDDGFGEASEVVDAETSTTVELAALMLDDNVEEVYSRVMELPLVSVPSILSLSSAIVAMLAERLADILEVSPDEILSEFQVWSNEED